MFDGTVRSFTVFYKSTCTGFSYPLWKTYRCYPRYLVTFNGGSAGSITGESTQVVNRGSSCTQVTAVPIVGNLFVKWTWSVGNTNMESTQNPLALTNVIDDMDVTANFIVNTSIATDGTPVNVPEEGTAVFRVKLCAPPTDTKTVTVSWLSGDTNISVSSGGSLTFNSTTWNDWQDVTLAAAKDADAVNGTAKIRCSASGLTSTDVTATEIDNDYTLKLTNDGKGTTDPAISIVVNKGVAQNISATPNIGCHFSIWTVTAGTGAFGNEFNDVTFFTASANATIKANFAHDTNTLTMGTSGNGTTTPSADKVVNAYVLTPISARADANWHFVNWTLVNGAGTITNISASSTTFTPKGADGATATIQAVFEHNTAVLTMIDGENGTITPVAGSSTVDTATPIPVTATVVTPNYHFSKWTVTGGAKVANATSANTTVSLTANGTVKANFAHDTAVLTMAKFGGLSITPAVGAKSVDTVTAIPITATEKSAAYPFVNWTVLGNAIVADPNTANTTVTLTGNATVTANFIMPIVSGTAISAISGTAGNIKMYKINVPAGQVLFEVKSYVGTGDADLTVSKDGTILRYGSSSTNNENLKIENPEAGDYIISLIASDSYSGLSLMAKYYNTKPLPPTSVAATKGTYPDAILVSWKASAGAASYLIYRAESKVIPADPPLAETSDLSYVDTKDAVLDAGKTFNYWVKAKNAAGTSAPSTMASGSVSNIPAAPASVAASDGTCFDRIRVTWPKVLGATSYELYRSPTKAITGASIANPCVITATAHGFADGDTVLINGITGTMGALINGKNFVVTLVDADTFSISVDTRGKTYLSGGIVSIVPSIPIDSIAYNSKVSTYTYDDMGGADPSPNTGTLKYCYWIKARNGNGVSAAKCDTGYVSCKGPSGVTASKGTFFNQVKITWTAVPGATGYEVYRSGTVGSIGSPIPATGTEYYDDIGADPTVFYYQIRANCNGYYSNYSISSSGFAKLSITTLPAPVMKSVSNCAGNYIKIAWGEVPLAVSYNLYRDGVPYKSLAALSYTEGPADVSVGQAYKYCVTAVNGIESAKSATKTGYAAGDLSAPAIDFPVNTYSELGLVEDKGVPRFYRFEVPAGISRLVVKAENVEGSCDLYAKLNSYPTTLSYNAKGTLVTGTTGKILTVSNPAAGYWYILLYGSGTSGYDNVDLYIGYYTSTNIVLTEVPLDGKPVPFTAAFKGRVLDRDGVGIPGLYLKVRDPLTGVKTWLPAKTDAKGCFVYSTTVKGEGEYTYDFFFNEIPDADSKSIASWTVKTMKSPGGTGGSFFDSSCYISGTQIPEADIVSQGGTVAGMQEYMNVRRGFDDGPADAAYDELWVENSLGACQADAEITDKLNPGLYLLLYGSEGAAVGNGKTAAPGLVASPLLVHVTSGATTDTVITNLQANGLIDNAVVDNITINGGAGVVVLTAVDNPAKEDISLYANEQLQLLANLAGNISLSVTSANDKTYSGIVTSLVRVNIGSMAIDVRIGSFPE
ncbi:MAG: pre-peptidase C-terminal domain-containing protein [Victivallales bacterium]